MGATWYPATGITGTDESLDKVHEPLTYTALSTGDMAFVYMKDLYTRIYTYDSTLTDAEDFFGIIVIPDGNVSGTGAWKEKRTTGLMTFWAGTIANEIDATVSEAGGVVSLDFECTGSIPGVGVWSDDIIAIPIQSVTLNHGSDIAPTENFAYILKADPVSIVIGSDWPATEHIKIGYFLVPSAAHVAATGAYINQNWNDGNEPNGMGHLAALGENHRLTQDGAHFHSGVTGNGATDDYITIVTADTPDSAYFVTTAGVCFQMHRHTVPAFNSQTDEMHIANAFGQAYKATNDIRDEEVDALNGSLTNKYYNVVFWMVANKSGEYAPVMMNMPTGSYNGLSNAINDVDGFDVYDIPRQFKEESATGFLVCRITFRQTASTITVHNTTDLRGRTPGSASGTSLVAGTEFADNQFKVYNVADDTKIVDMDLSGLTSPSTRTITPADADMTILSTVNHDDLTDGGDTTLHDHDGISENNTHRSSDGKDHSDVVLNNTHRASDGKDHSDVVLNNTHRTGDGSDHADVATNTGLAHAESHTAASHSDQSATGAELETLTDGSDADALHTHGAFEAKGKNLIINGAMQVAQRSTSVAAIGSGNSGYHTIDRWYFSEVGAPVGEFTMSQDSGLSAVGMPFDYAMKIDCTTAEDYTDVNSDMQILTRLEAQNFQHIKYGSADAEDMIFSFYTKGNKAGTMCVTVTQPDGSRQYVTEVSITGNGSWERKSITIPGDTSGVINNDNGAGFHIRFVLTAGTGKDDATAGSWVADSGDDATSNQTNFLDNTANNLWITGVQLEVGSALTDYDHQLIENVLRLCYRFYIRVVSTGSNMPVGSGYSTSTTSLRGMIPTPVTMRFAPAITGIAGHYGPSGPIALASISAITVTSHSIRYRDTVVGATTARAYTPYMAAATDFELDSEI